MKILTSCLFWLLLFPSLACTDQTSPVAAHPSPSNALTSDYIHTFGFNERQIVHLEIVDNHTMKISVDECSLCSVFKNAQARDDMARKTLEWFLHTMQYEKGSVEWYNQSQIKILSISGTSSKAEITFGEPCARPQ